MKGDILNLIIVRGHMEAVNNTSANLVTPMTSNEPGPACRYVNIELLGTGPQKGLQATVLLENPRGQYQISFRDLVHQVQNVEIKFEYSKCKFNGKNCWIC